MIRDYKPSDIEDIVRIYTQEYMAMPAEVEELKSASKILVYDDQGIQGFIHLAISGKTCYMEMGTSANAKFKTVGLELWNAAKIFLAKNSIELIQTFHVKSNLAWQEFFNEIGFEYWYSVHRFYYDGKRFDEPNIHVVKYDDQYFEEKIKLESEAFAALREANNIKPFNWYLGASKEAIDNVRKATFKSKEHIYLFFENDQMIGASMIKDAEIELFFVTVKYQGKGYGRKILEFAVNRGLEQNPLCVSLNVLASNDKALRIYQSVGFRLLQAQDCRKLTL